MDYKSKEIVKATDIEVCHKKFKDFWEMRDREN